MASLAGVSRSKQRGPGAGPAAGVGASSGIVHLGGLQQRLAEEGGEVGLHLRVLLLQEGFDFRLRHHAPWSAIINTDRQTKPVLSVSLT